MSGDKLRADLTYDGTMLSWPGVGRWNATSGLKGFQEPRYQNRRDQGPIPEGEYEVPLTLGGDARVLSAQREPDGSVSEATLDRRDAIESLTCVQHPYERGQVLLFEEWGSNRVRLRKLRLKHASTRHRAGFYIHDSNKGYSHGCIEVDTDFFRALREFSRRRYGSRKSLQLEVKYTGNSTLGATEKLKKVIVHCD